MRCPCRRLRLLLLKGVSTTLILEAKTFNILADYLSAGGFNDRGAQSRKQAVLVVVTVGVQWLPLFRLGLPAWKAGQLVGGIVWPVGVHQRSLFWKF